MGNKFNLFFLMLLLTISFSSALDSLGTAKQNELVIIKQTCASCTFVNFSVTIPNSSFVLTNLAMVDQGGGVWAFNFSNTSVIGRYDVVGIGDINGVSTSFATFFLITKNGFELTESESRVYTLLFISFLILLGISLFVSIVTPFSNEVEIADNILSITKVTFSKYLKVLAIWFTYGLYLMLLTLLTGLTQNYVNFPEMKSLMTSIYTYSYFLGYGITTGILALLFILIWKDIIFNKQIIKSGKAFIRELER